MGTQPLVVTNQLGGFPTSWFIARLIRDLEWEYDTQLVNQVLGGVSVASGGNQPTRATKATVGIPSCEGLAALDARLVGLVT